jgi:PAS domain S-box-containing protein
MKPGLEGSGGTAEQGEPRLGVLEASPNAIVAIEGSGRIIYANPQVEATFGYHRAELIGEPVEVLIPARLGERHARHRAGLDAECAIGDNTVTVAVRLRTE